MFKNDFIEQQIEILCKTFAALIFGKKRAKDIIIEDVENGFNLSTDDKLAQLMIDKLVAQGNFNEAEDMVFKLVESKPSAAHLRLALEFYNKLNEIDEKKLQDNGFLKEEIKEGIEQLKKMYQDFKLELV